MKFLFIIPSITNYFTFLEDIALELEEGGHDIVVASSTKHISDINCYDRKVVGRLIDIEFPRGFELFAHLRVAKKLEAIVEQIRPDVINVHFSAAMFTTALAKKQEWPPTYSTIHGLAFPILKGWRKLAVGTAERWAAKRMDKVILLNEYDRNALLKHKAVSHIHVLDSYGLGCDLEKFDRRNISEEIKLKYHRRLGIKNEDFVFIFVGRQVDFKGFDKLVRAFLGVYEDHKNLKLILVGGKDNIHPTNLTSAEELRMKQCPGIINVGWKENVQEYLTVADVNIFPSTREGMPVNLMESLAMGVPVITTDSRGCNEVVIHGVNGLLLDDITVDSIMKLMLELYLNREKLGQFSVNALAMRHNYDRQDFIKEMVLLLEPSEATMVAAKRGLSLTLH